MEDAIGRMPRHDANASPVKRAQPRWHVGQELVLGPVSATSCANDTVALSVTGSSDVYMEPAEGAGTVSSMLRWTPSAADEGHAVDVTFQAVPGQTQHNTRVTFVTVRVAAVEPPPVQSILSLTVSPAVQTLDDSSQYRAPVTPPQAGLVVRWSSERNGVPTGEVGADYGHRTDAQGRWQGVGDIWRQFQAQQGHMDGSWTKTVDIYDAAGQALTHATASFTVQAGRYAAALDPTQPAAGPTGPVP